MRKTNNTNPRTERIETMNANNNTTKATAKKSAKKADKKNAATVVGKKTCKQCGKERSFRMFEEDKRSKDGYGATCLVCQGKRKDTATFTGRHHTPETLAKISAAVKATGAKPWNKGKTGAYQHDEAARKRISDAVKAANERRKAEGVTTGPARMNKKAGKKAGIKQPKAKTRKQRVTAKKTADVAADNNA